MKWLKVGSVIFGALIITALGIDAADTLSGSRGTLLGQLVGSPQQSACEAGMVEVNLASTFTCVDVYEASALQDCPYPSPQNEEETRLNLESTTCGASSGAEVLPWRFITREQANVACMKSGKRLPTNQEWHVLASGTRDDRSLCNMDGSGVLQTAANSQCVSAIGVINAIGNVWEWTSDDVISGVYKGRELPSSGYVTQVDNEGVATLTTLTPSELFYKDYFWSSKEGAYGIMRGGFYGSKSDAGVYAVHAQTLPTAAGTAIGFRCLR